MFGFDRDAFDARDGDLADNTDCGAVEVEIDADVDVDLRDADFFIACLAPVGCTVETLQLNDETFVTQGLIMVSISNLAAHIFAPTA